MYRNHVEVMGFVGNDVELRRSAAGHAFARVSVATSEGWKDREGRRQERTTWHTAFFWGKSAELAAKLLRKGAHVFVEGSLRSSQDRDERAGGARDGSARDSVTRDSFTRDSFTIVGRDFRLLDRRERGGAAHDQGGHGASGEDDLHAGHRDEWDAHAGSEDVPF